MAGRIPGVYVGDTLDLVFCPKARTGSLGLPSGDRIPVKGMPTAEGDLVLTYGKRQRATGAFDGLGSFTVTATS